jgi:hypothetical protein
MDKPFTMMRRRLKLGRGFRAMRRRRLKLEGGFRAMRRRRLKLEGGFRIQALDVDATVMYMYLLEQSRKSEG